MGKSSYPVTGVSGNVSFHVTNMTLLPGMTWPWYQNIQSYFSMCLEVFLTTTIIFNCLSPEKVRGDPWSDYHKAIGYNNSPTKKYSKFNLLQLKKSWFYSSYENQEKISFLIFSPFNQIPVYNNIPG